jgi:CrcB protein
MIPAFGENHETSAMMKALPISTLLLLTFAGSAIGGLMRHAVSGFVATRFGERFPAGTMVVNVTGAFMIGIVWSAPWTAESPGPASWLRDFLMFGVLGGYTTVSSFTLNTLALLQEGEWRSATLHLVGSWLLCLGAVATGAALASGWVR